MLIVSLPEWRETSMRHTLHKNTAHATTTIAYLKHDQLSLLTSSYIYILLIASYRLLIRLLNPTMLVSRYSTDSFKYMEDQV